MLRLALALTTALAVSLAVAPIAAAQTSPYKQFVDNASPRFSASDNWKTSSWSTQKAGKDYRYADPKTIADNAAFKIKTPRTTKYKVFARWPATNGYNTSAAFGISTTSGLRWKRVDQTKNSGKWMRLGTFELKAGDSRKVFVSRRSGSDGYVVADAVRVVEAEPPPQPKDQDDSGGATRQDAVLQEAKSWLGVPYRYGGASREGVDCSGLTLRVFEKVNIALPRTAAAQYERGRATDSPRVGDLAFGDYNDSGNIEHVGIYSGDGEMINAPYPGTVVRYDPIYPRYHVGYRDLLS